MTDLHAGESDLLAAFLQDSDARCPECRYALRGCTSGKCPECGTRLTLSIATQDTHDGWWLASVIGIGTAWLTSVALLVMLLPHIASSIHDPRIRVLVAVGQAPTSALPNWPGVISVSLLTGATGLWLAWVLGRRRALRLASNRMRVTFGLLGAAAPLITLGLVAILLRVLA